MQLQLRLATIKDAQFVLDLRNEEGARIVSFETDVIPWETHIAWYTRALEDPTRSIYIVQQERESVGMVRLDQQDDRRAEVSLAIIPEKRGKGLGSQVLSEACAEASRLGYEILDARIKGTNEASIRAFARAGFEYWKTQEGRQCSVTRMRREVEPVA